MKTITICGKDYKFEYTIEASLYSECTETIMDTFLGLGKVQGLANTNDVNGFMEELKNTIANVPIKALTLFHAGLLENHDFSKEESKELLKAYIKESGKSFSDVLGELMEIMTEDNFFDLIGLNQMFQTTKRGRKKKENTEVGESTSNEE